MIRPARIASAPFRLALSLIGRYRLDQMLANGLPARLGVPLRFLLTKRLSEEDRLVADRIEQLRVKMASRDDAGVEIFPSPEPGSAGTTSFPDVRPAPGQVRIARLSDIAKTASVLPYWGAFLYLCANANRARTILELGGCAGVSGCYLASGKNCDTFITIEGSHSWPLLPNPI